MADCGNYSNNSSDLFTITPSRNEECYTVLFHSKDAYSEMADKLAELYDFRNINNSAITASTTTEGGKVVLTLYKNQKLLIQGVGGKTWKSTTFLQLISELKTIEHLDKQTPQIGSRDTPIRTPTTFIQETPFPPKYKKSSSPLGFISKLFGSPTVSGDPTNYSPNNSAHQKSPVFNKKKNKRRYSTPQNYKHKKSVAHNCENIVPSSQNETEGTFVDDEITFLKQTYQQEPPAIPVDSFKESKIQNKIVKGLAKGDPEGTRLPSPSLLDTDMDSTTKESNDPDNREHLCTSQKKEDNASSTDRSIHQECPCKDYDKELEGCKTELSSLKKENKELQLQFKNFMTQSNLLRVENERLLQATESCKEENKTITQDLQKEIQKSKQYEKEIKTLNFKLSEETALALSLDEENKKLQKKLENVSKEKKALTDQMVKITGTSDLIEEKIETGFDNLKDLFLKEMSDLKNQFEKSVLFSRTISTSSTSMAPRPSVNGTWEVANTTEADMELQTADKQINHVFIAGDSTTSILSRNKMSDANLQVKIKSHQDGKLQDIHNTS